MTCTHPRQTLTLEGIEHHLPCAACGGRGTSLCIATTKGVLKLELARVALPVDVVPLDGWQDGAGWLWGRR